MEGMNEQAARIEKQLTEGLAAWTIARESPQFASMLACAAVVADRGLPALRECLSDDEVEQVIVLACQALVMYAAMESLGNTLASLAGNDTEASGRKDGPARENSSQPPKQKARHRGARRYRPR